MKKVDGKLLQEPEPPRSFEIARSGDLNLRCLRQIAMALYSNIQIMSGQHAEKDKPLQTSADVAAEYNYTLKTLDDFYAKARNGIGDVKIYLVAESGGFTKQMEIYIKDKDELSLAK